VTVPSSIRTSRCGSSQAWGRLGAVDTRYAAHQRVRMRGEYSVVAEEKSSNKTRLECRQECCRSLVSEAGWVRQEWVTLFLGVQVSKAPERPGCHGVPLEVQDRPRLLLSRSIRPQRNDPSTADQSSFGASNWYPAAVFLQQLMCKVDAVSSAGVPSTATSATRTSIFLL